MTYTLDRLNIVRDIDEQTPLIVITEIAEAHNISFDRSKTTDAAYLRNMVKTIKTKKVLNVKHPIKDLERMSICKYLGITSIDTDSEREASIVGQWTPAQLVEILDYWQDLRRLLDSYQDIKIVIDSIGPPTLMHPKSLNACFLYKICTNNGMVIPKDVTLDHLGALASITQQSAKVCVDLLNSFIVRSSLDRLLPLFCSMPEKHIKDFTPLRSDIVRDTYVPVTYQDLESLTNNHYFMNNYHIINPKNDCEAVASAALKYEYNLFRIPFPLVNYHKLKQLDMESIQNFVPGYCDVEKLKKNPLIYRLDYCFDVEIPPQFYSRTALRRLKNREGLLSSTAGSIYIDLQVRYLSLNFYDGWYPTVRNVETPFICEEVQDMDSSLIICYGVFSENMIALHVEELTMMFRQHQSFINKLCNPHDVFSKESIKKLKLICSEPVADDYARQKRIECFNEISFVEHLDAMTGETLHRFYLLYSGLSTDRKQFIKHAITLIYHMALYMRNWRGPDTDHPVSEIVSDDQINIDSRVTESIAAFENFLATDQTIAVEILKLPIFRYHDITSRFYSANTTKEGYTLLERINIVKSGDSNNQNSCIKISSNWFAASAYRYSQMLGLPLPFEITQWKFVYN